MAAQKTIAFIGGMETTCPVLIKKLVQEDLHLLFICRNEEEMKNLSQSLNFEGEAEVEFIGCAKDACWEADIIAFVAPEKLEGELLEKIKEVATQKIVLYIARSSKEIPATSEAASLRELLPNSKIVQVIIDSEKLNASVTGMEEEAIAIISEIFEKAEFNVSFSEEL